VRTASPGFHVGTGGRRLNRAGALDRRTIGDVLLARLVTLPLAAALGVVSYVAVRAVR